MVKKIQINAGKILTKANSIRFRTITNRKQIRCLGMLSMIADLVGCVGESKTHHFNYLRSAVSNERDRAVKNQDRVHFQQK